MKLKNILTAVVGSKLTNSGISKCMGIIWICISRWNDVFVYVKLFNSSSYRNNKDSSSK